MSSPRFHRSVPTTFCALTLLFLSFVRPLPAQTHASAAPQADNPPAVRQESVSAVAGQPFTYQVRAANSPTSYSAANLADGLTLDPRTGLISGTPTMAGIYTVALAAANAAGGGTADLQLVVFLRPVPTVTIAFEHDASLTGGVAKAGSFLLTRTGGDIADEVRVNLAVAGGAVGGVDYAVLKGMANVNGNKGFKHLRVNPLGHGATGGGKKSVKVTLQPGVGYVLGASTTAKLKLIDAD